jgi:hypothetical protein
LGTLAKLFSATTKKSPSLPELTSAVEGEDAMVADLADLAAPKQVVVPAHLREEEVIGMALEDWKRSTKLSVTVTGQSQVGKSHLINTLLEASAPEEYEHARRDNVVPSIEITPESGDCTAELPYAPDMVATGSAGYAATSYSFSASTSPDVSPPSSGRFSRSLETSPPPSATALPPSYSPPATSPRRDSEELQVETLRSDLRHMAVDTTLKQYRKETGYSFEGNTVVSTAPRSRRNSSSEMPSHGRVYKGFTVDEFMESTTRAAEHVYTPVNTPYASVPATPGGSEISELELDTRDNRRSTYKRATVYLFNGVSTEEDTGKAQVNVVPMASRTFFPDELWSSTIDWRKERQSSNDYQTLVDQAMASGQNTLVSADGEIQQINSNDGPAMLPPVKIDDTKSYLLPQGQNCNVPQLVAVRYGRIPELIVTFPHEGELRLALWELHEIVFLGTKQFQSEQHKSLTETRYRRLLGLSDDSPIPLANVESPQDLPLDHDVQMLLGQNFRFAGLGKSLAQDRVFVRDKLQEITNNYAYHMCKFLVRVPSSILDGNKELIEMSGPYIHGDFGTKNAIENTNLLLVAVDRVRGLSSDIVHLLQDSSLAQKLATKPELHKAIFVELAERYNLALPTDSNFPSTVDSFKQTLLDQWRQALLLATTESPALLTNGSNAMDESSSAPVPDSSAPHSASAVSSHESHSQLFNSTTSVSMRSAISEATLEQLVASTSVLEAKPTLFRSVHLQDDFPRELLPDNDAMSVREILKQTAIPEILSTIPNRLIAKAAVTVKQLSQAVLLKNNGALSSQASVETIEYRKQLSSESATARLESSLSSFGLLVTNFKSELMSSSRRMEPEISATAAQCSSRLLAAYNPRSMSVEQVAVLVRNDAARPLVESAQHAWRLAISEVPRQAGMILGAMRTLLSECATVIDIHMPSRSVPDAELTAKQLKLQEFVRTTNDNCNKYMARFQDELNQDVAPLAKDASIKTLQQHIIADPQTGRLSHVQDLPALCPKIATAIYVKFSVLFKTAIAHLDALQTDVVRALRAVTFAIKTQVSEVSGQNQSSSNAGMVAPSPMMMSEDDPSSVQRKLAQWNAANTNARPNQGSAMDLQDSEATIHHVGTISSLAAQNALNWPSIADDLKSHMYRRNSMEIVDDMDTSRLDGLHTVYESAQDDPSSYSRVLSDPSLPGPSQYDHMMSTDGSGLGELEPLDSLLEQPAFIQNEPSPLLAPWADIKGTYTVLPQEESGVLFQYQLWDQVKSNASSRFLFESMLKNCRLAMGRDASECFADANAQFKILANQVYGNEATHSIVRLLVCSEMLSNPEYYAHLLFQSRPHTTRMLDIQEYIALMSHEGCRGDNVTLCAFSNFFGVDLLIFAPPFRQPILLRSHRSTSQAHLAVVADQLQSTRLAATFTGDDGASASLSTSPNKAFCIAMLPDDEFALVKQLKTRRRRTAHMRRGSNDSGAPLDSEFDEDSEYDIGRRGSSSSSHHPASGPVTGRQRHARMAQLRKAFDRRKAMETQIEPSSPNGTTFYRGENAYEDFNDSDDYDYNNENDDSISDSEASQAEIARALRSTSKSKKKRKRSQQMADSSTSHIEPAAMETSESMEIDSAPSSQSMRIPFKRSGGSPQSTGEERRASGPYRQHRRGPSSESSGYTATNLSQIPEEEDVDVLYGKKFKFATSEDPHAPVVADAPLLPAKTVVDINSMDMSVENAPMEAKPKSTSSVKMHPFDPILSNRICAPPSLVDICLHSLVDSIESGAIASLAGQVPEEYLQKVLLILSERKKLTDTNVARVLDPIMTNLMIYGPCAQITDITMTNVAHECTMLKEIVLVQCSNISTTGLMAVAASSPLLEHLTIKGCAGIGNRAIQEVARKCPRLEYIDISGCPQVTDIAIKDLFLACPQLSTVIMQHCNQVTDEAFTHYVGKNIQVLDMLESEQITNKSLSSIARHCGPRLRILKISGRGISDTGIETLSRACVELRVAEITHAENITDAAVTSLWRHCPHLFTLNIAHCRQVSNMSFGPKLTAVPPIPTLMLNGSVQFEDKDTERAFEPIASDLPDDAPVAEQPHGIPSLPIVPMDFSFRLPSELTKINLAMCMNVGDDALRQIAFQCPSLRQLTLSYCEEISDIGLIAIALQCTDLRGLDITKCAKVSNLGVKSIAERCPRLKRLMMGSIQAISDETALILASRCPYLRDLDLCSSSITDTGLIAIGASCPNLRLIALSDCRLITSFGLSALASCPLIEIIRLSGCKAIDDSSIIKLSIGCPLVMELDLAHCNSVSSSRLRQALAAWSKLVTLNLRGYTPLRRQNEEETEPTRISHPNVEDLNLSWCKFVDDAMIAAMADGSPNLITLDLGWCTSVTANSFHRLVQKCRNLRTLNLRGCTKVGPLSVQYLSAASVVVYR